MNSPNGRIHYLHGEKKENVGQEFKTQGECVHTVRMIHSKKNIPWHHQDEYTRICKCKIHGWMTGQSQAHTCKQGQLSGNAFSFTFFHCKG